MEEIWKDIEGYPNYMISSYGRVKSLNYNHTGREEILKPKITNGYYRIGLRKNGKRKFYQIHRLVYETFIGEIPQGIQVNHINEVKTDNRLENLNLMTPKENINWGTGIQRRAEKRKGKALSEEHKKKLSESHKGENHPNYGKHLSEETRKKISKAQINRKDCSKPVLQIDKNTNEVIAEFPSASDIYRLYGYSFGNICNCCRGLIKSAYGFKWRYKQESAA